MGGQRERYQLRCCLKRLSQCFSNLPFTSHLHPTLPYARIIFDISVNQLIFFNVILKGKPEDNNNKNTLTGTKVRKGHGPRDKKLHPELEDTEG